MRIDTVQARKLPMDQTLTITLAEGDFHLKMPDYEPSIYRNIRDEMAYRVDTHQYFCVSPRIKKESFVRKWETGGKINE